MGWRGSRDVSCLYAVRTSMTRIATFAMQALHCGRQTGIILPNTSVYTTYLNVRLLGFMHLD